MPKQRPKRRGLRPILPLGKSKIASDLVDAFNEGDWEAVLDIAYDLDPSQFEEGSEEEEGE